MAERFGGLRVRLTAAIATISLVLVTGSFFALRETTGADLRDRIDRELNEQFAEFDQQALATPISGTRQLERRARHFLTSQRYHPKSRIFVIQVDGGSTVTNERRVLEAEEQGESREGSGDNERALPRAGPGLTTVSTEEAGRLRVLSREITSEGRHLGAFRVAEPLSAVDEAQSGLTNAFIAVGIAALVISAVAALWVATVLTRPLRKMAAIASAVDAGELEHRIGPTEHRDEVGVLAEAFDHMLDRLEDAFRRQEAFVSDASHELRTPLTILRGQIESLEHESDPRQRERSLETVIRELDHMGRLVSDMLTLASAGSELVNPQPIDLAGFLQDLRRDLPLMGDFDYRVEGPREGVIDADPERLSQVFRNLVLNAAAVSDPGERIDVTASPSDGGIEFAVRDRGPGIPPAELTNVFDRFHRGQAGGRDGGTGLGLAIARAIVEAHGGRIWAESAEGAGATVRFWLPNHGRR